MLEKFIFISSTVSSECKGTIPLHKTVCEVDFCVRLSMNWSLFNWHATIGVFSGWHRFWSFENSYKIYVTRHINPRLVFSTQIHTQHYRNNRCGGIAHMAIALQGTQALQKGRAKKTVSVKQQLKCGKHLYRLNNRPGWVLVGQNQRRRQWGWHHGGTELQTARKGWGSAQCSS